MTPGIPFPNLPLARIETLDAIYDRSLAQTSFTLVMLAVAGAMALLLGVIGIQGVIAYAVAQRRREIGVRMALGARPADIQRLFMRRGMVLTGIGLALGAGGGMLLARSMRGLLFGVEPLDPTTFVAVPAVLVVTALLATYVPARRALKIDPVEAMRAE